MNWLTFVPLYFQWHYTKGTKDLVAVWSNFLWFEFHFFSVPVMLKTLFVPFRRLGETYPKFIDFEEFFSALLVNTLMRIVGAVLRLCIIVVGLLTWVILFGLGIAVFAAWLLLPALLVVMFINGLSHLV